MNEPAWIATWDQQQGGRSYQEDCAVVFRDPQGACWLAIVADGVGGHGGGDRAARVILEVAQRHWDQGEARREHPRRFLERLCQAANQRISALERELGFRARSTIVALLVQGDQGVIAHSGDSRLYHFRDGVLRSRTRDHSVLQILLEQGKVREEDMGKHPDQGRLLQSLGDPEMKEPEFTELKVDGRDAFLLCTDGFWEKISRPEMERFIRARDELEANLRVLVNLAAKRGGSQGDNVSAAVLVGTGHWTPDRVIPETMQILKGDVRSPRGTAPSFSTPLPAGLERPAGFRTDQRWATGPILALLIAAMVLVLILISTPPKPQHAAAPAHNPPKESPASREAHHSEPIKTTPKDGDDPAALATRERMKCLTDGETGHPYLDSAVTEKIKQKEVVASHYPFYPMRPSILTVGQANLRALRKQIEDAADANRWAFANEHLDKWEKEAEKLRSHLKEWATYTTPPTRPITLPIEAADAKSAGFPLSVVWVPGDPPLWIAQTEFTYGQYQAYKQRVKAFNQKALLKDQLRPDPLQLNERTGDSGLPVTNVSWADAKALAADLTSLTISGGEERLFDNWQYDLPTTTEWYDRALIHAYPSLQNFDDLKKDGRRDLLKDISGNRTNRLYPARALRRCQLGTYDMVGNAAEWCADANKPRNVFGVVKDWAISTGSDGATIRVVAGGSYQGKPDELLDMRKEPENHKADDIGFRLVIRRIH